jgi:hypothetical protein
MGNAIMHANREAERHAQRHYDAREEYMSRRRLSPSRAHPAKEEETMAELDQQVVSPSNSGRAKSALLLRMAALLKKEGSIGLDESAVEQFFPGWIRPTQDVHHWNDDAVLRDLVMAVSQLAYTVSVDNPPAHALPKDEANVPNERMKALPLPELLSDDAPT